MSYDYLAKFVYLPVSVIQYYITLWSYHSSIIILSWCYSKYAGKTNVTHSQCDFGKMKTNGN